MAEELSSSSEVRMEQLEKRLRLFQTISSISVFLIAVVAVSVLIRARSHDSRSTGVLRVRGLIIEDASGRERIVIGAPVPAVNGRKRHDDTVGLIVLGENGADRVALAAPTPEPQIHGIIGKRIGGQAGLVVDDENGNERGGMGVLDNDGRVTLGLDYSNGEGEAITLGVLPGENSIAMHDSKSIIRAAFLERKDSAPIMYGVHFVGQDKIDMGILRLNPYGSRHIVTPANDDALNKALDDMSMK